MRVFSASESLVSSTKPMPGVNGFWATGGRVVGSSLRRHERQRTPARRMIVPRAILRDCQLRVEEGADWDYLREGHEGASSGSFD